MKAGDRVIFNEKEYIIIHVYESGYLEIKEGNIKVELVSSEEVKPANPQ